MENRGSPQNNPRSRISHPSTVPRSFKKGMEKCSAFNLTSATLMCISSSNRQSEQLQRAQIRQTMRDIVSVKVIRRYRHCQEELVCNLRGTMMHKIISNPLKKLTKETIFCCRIAHLAGTQTEITRSCKASSRREAVRAAYTHRISVYFVRKRISKCSRRRTK